VPISTDAVATPASNASFQGVIKADGTGGTVTLQWAQNSAHASDTKMLAGTWLAYQLLN
jgi:hypothetical protein